MSAGAFLYPEVKEARFAGILDKEEGFAKKIAPKAYSQKERRGLDSPLPMAYWSLGIALFAIVTMLLALAFKSEIKVGRFRVETFWMGPFFSALILLVSGLLKWDYYFASLSAPSAINPLEILVLFLAMTFLSIVLDEAGFFAFLAAKAVFYAKGSAFALFSLLYALTSFLTIFTSNDIIILTFTPFILFFAKSAKLDPIPYLVGEFVAANTWSLLFLIGNPTNIYLGESFGLSFGRYFLAMWPSTLLAGVTSYLVMILLFHKSLRARIISLNEPHPIQDRFLFVSALSCLGVCLCFLILSNFLSLPMWAIAGVSALALLLLSIAYVLFRPAKRPLLGNAIKRLPYPIIPFILAMFAVVMALKENGWTLLWANGLSSLDEVWGYGWLSFFACNLINNIPMAVLFSEILAEGGASLKAVYATIIGSNLGAFLTPVGALAGVMWMSILKRHGVSFSFLRFAGYGVLIALPSMAMALLGLLF